MHIHGKAPERVDGQEPADQWGGPPLPLLPHLAGLENTFVEKPSGPPGDLSRFPISQNKKTRHLAIPGF